jgi:hypothetical protein
MKTLLPILVLLLVPVAASAGDLLYADDGKALYVVDQTTGAKTFVSDGTLRWLCSPGFDEAHHTVLGGGVDLGYDETGWVLLGSWGWENPFTGERGGPYPGTVSSHIFPFEMKASGLQAYAPTTRSIYTVFYANDPIVLPYKIDIFNGPVSNFSGNCLLRERWDFVQPTAMAYDPTTDKVLIAMNGIEDHWLYNYGVVGYPVTAGGDSLLLIPFSHNELDQYGGSDSVLHIDSILAMDVEKTTGDIYFVREELARDDLWSLATTNYTLRRWDRALGQDFEICTLDAPLQLRFASDEYIR